MEGSVSDDMKEIMNDDRLVSKFMDYALATPQDKLKFRFVRYETSGKLDIIDTRVEPEPALLTPKHG